ncbi:helix-turn-helix transcriptional regulator [Bacillus atrophaeus]|uniref:helix-turn-helix domain-containing protein n=1 Tax=Bacillus atrophaeus TaxID=1452 RepID=UPI002281287C|nr:helix-turn-helix transcriptional regulator [Bacillus atrophaeus]MCY8504518.1 helix-turn-helix transcriptional regulator [Bacillus atrophaeus]MCY8813624.1 helix-turn-helix transcriptional regulator [Bacillus atrophaeus]MCY8820303.1 helix-turn-helix transcriptional regulator [Bacillus atrophaeus]MCY8828573.1 helix-turn-helix transcriptional regulator [Bacillus atrophaeus]MCY8832660.1 helix-turn-helix transcriptional regulator [Bacillus atrophaeus]
MNQRTWLLNIRTTANMTQEEVANEAEIKRPYYSQIESGVRRPSVQVAKKISEVLGFDWALFFENECSEKRQSVHTA